MDARQDLEEAKQLTRALCFFRTNENAAFLKTSFNNILNRYGDGVPLPENNIWPTIVHMLITAGEHDIATRIMNCLVKANAFRHAMARALSLLEDGKTIAAAYAARTTESYDLIIGANASFATPPVVTDEILALPADARLLEVGCGTGLTGAFLRQAGYSGRMVGVDLVEDMVAAVPAGLYDELAVADACAWLANDSRTWDAIVSFGVFVHLPETVVRQLVGLAAQRLKAGGVLAFNAPEEEAPIWHALPLAKAAILFDEAGLEMEAVKRDEERTTYLCRKVGTADA